MVVAPVGVRGHCRPKDGVAPLDGVNTMAGEGQGRCPGGVPEAVSKRWAKKGLGVWWSTQERAFHCFNLTFSQVVNTPGIPSRWVAGPM